jgi:DNA ligase-1
MRDFADLYDALDASTAQNDKLAALVRYFAHASDDDAAWAVTLLAGGKPRQVVPMAVLRDAACRMAGVDDWLFEACYQAVGDLAETIAHLLPAPELQAAAAAPTPSPAPAPGLAQWMTERLLPLRGLPAAEQVHRVQAWWRELTHTERFVLIKMVGGGFRVGVGRLVVQRALAQHTGLDAQLLAQRLVGWADARATPSAARWRSLVAAADSDGDDAPAGHPYPFFLAHALQAEPQTLGPLQDWLLEWKYDGIRAQVVKRSGQVWIWSRGEELVSERFPEVVAQAARLPDGTVLDGELLVWLPGSELPAPFKVLQTRINRKTVGKKLLADAPVVFMAYDLLEGGGVDLRGEDQQARRGLLETVLAPFVMPAAAATPPPVAQPLASAVLRLSPLLACADWEQAAALREQARQRGFEGFMLKSTQARYGSGRTKSDGTWWKWKLDPYSVDAVLVYAQAGHGRRASVYTDYTFAVWSRAPAGADEAQAVLDAIARREPAPRLDSGALQLLPFAKAYSGLTDEEFKAVDKVVRATTLEKFGPVRSLRPTLVFEIGFEGIGASPRHKSGVAVRFPRMLRIRHDKPLHEADTLATLLGLIQSS